MPRSSESAQTSPVTKRTCKPLETGVSRQFPDRIDPAAIAIPNEMASSVRSSGECNGRRRNDGPSRPVEAEPESQRNADRDHSAEVVEHLVDQSERPHTAGAAGGANENRLDDEQWHRQRDDP